MRRYLYLFFTFFSFFFTTWSHNTPLPSSLQEELHAVTSTDVQPALVDRISTFIDGLATTTSSWWLQLVAAFLIGLLMSLTPCVYPMIPITAGILQSYGSKSFTQNLIASGLYALGIATTFSCFGLISAYTGILFGNLLTNPFFVVFLIVVLGYMGLSMLGFIDMYIPSFMQPAAHVKKKSIFSSFVFGVISGSVASPCLTPGLALLLTLVAAMGSKVMGFLLLFVAGIGLSIPLLLIGAFSSSLSILPRAGMWMIEVKKLFGFMLFGICFYFLQGIVPSFYFLLSLSLFTCISGVYYLSTIKRKDSASIKTLKYIMAGIFFALTGLVCATLLQPTKETHAPWPTNVNHAIEQATAENKYVFIDITGRFCSICKAIERTILYNKDVEPWLREHVVCVKIDASEQKEVYEELQKKYTIIGVPTLLLIDPVTTEQKGRWGSALYQQTPHEFLAQIKNLIEK